MVQDFTLDWACPNNPQVLMLLSLPMRDIFYLFYFYLTYHRWQCVPVLLSNGKCYPIFSSPQIWIGIPLSLTLLLLNMLNIMNVLNNLVTEPVLQNILYIIWPVSPLLMPLWISYSVLTLLLLRNHQHPIFSFNFFVGRCNPLSNIFQSGINKVNHLSVLIINHPRY